MFKSILIPVDIAQESSWKFAVPEAVELARAGQSRLTVMTVIRQMEVLFEGVYFPFQLERMIADAEAKLTRIVADYKSSQVNIEQAVRVGSIGREILTVAREYECDLIVMASHRQEMRDYLIGPNAAHVAAHAPCSVLVLRKFR